MTLDELAIKHKTDKSSLWHNYTPVYEKFLSEKRNDPIRLLEIGVSSASSLKMWQDYFPNAYICGIDIDTNCLNYLEGKMEVFIGSQTDKDFIANLSEQKGPFDIIIDDGSHKTDDIIVSFNTLFPLLKNNGFYIIEDLHTSYIEKYKGEYLTSMEFLLNLANDINLNGKYIDGDGCGDRQRQYSRTKDDFLFTSRELSIDAIHFYSSMAIIEKKVLK